MIYDRALDITPLGALPGFCLLGRVAVERARPGYRRNVAHRGRSNGIVQITLSGCGWCRSGDGRLRPIPVGSAMVFHTRRHQDLLYGLPEGGAWEFLYTDLDGSPASDSLGDIVAACGHVVALDPSHAAVQACARLLPREPLAHRTMPAAETARLGTGILLALAEATSAPGDRLVLAAMAWLRDRLDQSVAVAECAAALGISREHLTRRFTGQVGESPARWQLRQRIARARTLLAAPGASVAVVSAACGFTSPAHFAAVFRAETGARPRESLRT